MITGSNTNVKHRGKLFHVQTEDSGRQNPHVISHLFHGGTILASQKTGYAELLDLESDGLEKDVRGLIEDQHKSILARLKAGEFDAVIDQRIGGDTATQGVASDAKAADTASAGEAPPTFPVTEPALDDEPPSPPAPEQPSAFGASAQKPLDEVILDYLVEKARDRGGAGTSRSRKRG